MTDISVSPLVLSTLYEQLRELEMDAVLIRGRTEQLRETIGYLEGGVRRRGGRPRKPAEGASIAGGIGSPVVSMVNGPQGVAGAAHQPECDEQGPLPGIDDVRGILKEDVG